MIDTDSPPLDVAELARRLRAADPAVLLVPPRLLRRVIKRDRQLSGFGLQVPHRKCYVVGRDALLAVADPADLGVEPGRDLPPAVVLLPRPDPDRLAAGPPGPTLLKYWRLLFHTAVHRAVAARRLTAADVRDRVRAIGPAAFDEARAVLRQERFLLPGDDAAVYEEFAAVYLELAYFAPPLLPLYFPAVDDLDRVTRLLTADAEAPALFAATRPAGAPDPAVAVDTPDAPAGPDDAPLSHGALAQPRSPAESQVFAALAGRAAAAGNDVRAALRYAQAARTAPPKQVPAARAAAEGELHRLVKRLRAALGLTGDEAAAWRRALPALLAPAARGAWPAEARLLYDLQKACLAFERPAAEPHPAEWVYSHFRRPLVQPLPDQPLVSAVKYLRRAAGRLPVARLAEADRHALAALLHAAVHHAEARLRDRLRPRVVESLAAVGLVPANYPERVSRDKLVEELLDLVADRGHISMPDLRDALSRNQLKLPDLSGPGELFAGDPLLRANRELAVRLPGVYRRGEVYLRWLQRLSAATFGTRPGRWLTWNVLLPFGGAFLAIEGPLQIGHELVRLYRFVLRLVGLMEPLPPDHVHAHAPFPLGPWPAFLLVGVFFWLLVRVPAVRRGTTLALGAAGRVLRAVLIDAPAAVLRWPTLRAVLDSPPARFVARFVLKPLLPAALVWATLADWGFGPRRAATGGLWAFAAVVLFLTTRLSREFEEVTADWAVRRWEYLRDFLPGLARLIADAFKRVMEAIDRGLYAVDEWLQFRGTEGRVGRVVKIVAALAWGGVAYVLRLIITLFVEPQINPLKHFPVVTIAHKLLLPMIPTLTGVLEQSFGFEKAEAWLTATIVIGKIPGIFGFLVWEFKENWRLYAANRPATLRPVMVGHHGETVPRLLRPGFHSGTLPKLFAKLRRAERRALRDGDRRTARRHLEALHHVEEAVRRFAERELLAYVNGTPAWAATPLRVADVEAGSNRVRVDVAGAGEGEPLAVRFDEQSGWLVAGASDPDWRRLTADQSAVLDLALAGFYKVGGADLRRADIQTVLGPDAAYDVTAEGLVVWPDGGDEPGVVYDLEAGRPEIVPRAAAGKVPGELPAVAADRLVFRRRPVQWGEWVAAWGRVEKAT